MYKIKFTSLFNQSIKKLSKKYPNIIQDFKPLIEQLKQGNFQGDKLQGFSGLTYKARIASIDQNKGKSGGFRTIYYVITKDKEIFLMEVYAKAYQDNLTNEQKQAIKKLIEILNQAL
ncbi:MAG: type II toxin-antitoxin system RelE/ParE family toxin [Desulfamplus sp.]|nr:type II toxin-antitoxin system RelE/ParE family toxin [Desulfamplus sp.]